MKIYIDREGRSNITGFNGVDEITEREITYKTGELLSDALEKLGISTYLSEYPRDIGPRPSCAEQSRRFETDYYIALRTGFSRNKFENGAFYSAYRPTGAVSGMGESILVSIERFTNIQNRGFSPSPEASSLRTLSVPALIVTMGYLSNRPNAEFMSFNTSQLADGIAAGINTYCKGIPEARNGSQDFYQCYDGQSGRLSVSVLNTTVLQDGKARTPVENAEVSVYRGTDGKHTLVYKCLSGADGRCVPAELYCGEGNPRGMFCVCVRCDGYLPKNRWLFVKSGTTLYETVTLKKRMLPSGD